MKIHNPKSLRAFKEEYGLTNVQIGEILGYKSSRPYECRSVGKMLSGEWTGNWDIAAKLLNLWELEQ